MTTCSWHKETGVVHEMYPSAREVADDLPDRTREYLTQAIESTHAPAGSIMLSASAVDSMLKAKGLKDGSLYSRIDKAAMDHIITAEMALWAHDIRLDANNQRHSDESADLPSEKDALRAIDFVQALGNFLFVFPAIVARGRSGASADE